MKHLGTYVILAVLAWAVVMACVEEKHAASHPDIGPCISQPGAFC